MKAFRVVLVLLALTARVAGAADFSTAEQLYELGDYDGAFEILQTLAIKGDMRAQSRLARMFAEGIGVPRDDQAALHWFRQAAEQGSTEARYELALMYSLGLGVLQDRSRAAYWYRLLAEDGQLTAQYLLARKYETGSGVARNMSRALWWYRQAADQGHVGAQLRLGEVYSRGEGVDEDLVQAWAWFDVAAAKGDEVAAVKRRKLHGRLSEEQLAQAIVVSGLLRPPPAARPAASGNEPAPEAEPESVPAPEMVRIAAGCFANRVDARFDLVGFRLAHD